MMKRVIKYMFAILVAVFTVTGVASAKEVVVGLAEVAAELKKAEPGDRIVIKSGTYKDIGLKWKGSGTKEAPITIVAQTPGEVYITGASTLGFAGEWLHIEGLNFRDGYAPKGAAAIEYRMGDEVANNCRVTNCVVDSYNPSKRSVQYSYVLMYGRHNRFDHNSLLGKLNFGVTMIVILDQERSQQNYHRIDHNYFGERPVYGSNGGETLRVGVSQQAHTSSNTIVEDNLFERCDGEVEVVSIKSSDNIIRRNTFLECQGVLALRHGTGNIAEDNLFMGNGVRNTGGVRIVDSGHRVRNNTFVGLQGGRFYSALALMNAVPNSLPNRYVLVRDVEVTGNTFIECSNIEFGTGRDLERTAPPQEVLFADNIVINHSVDEPFMAIGSVDGVTFKNNKADLAKPVNIRGFERAKIKRKELPSQGVMREDRGAAWYKSEEVDYENIAQKVARVRAGDDLVAIVERAGSGDAIELIDAGGDYAISRALVVKQNLVIRAAQGLSAKPVIRFVGAKRDNMITIADGGELVVEGIAFDGRLEDGYTSAGAGVSSATDMIEPYNLTVRDCAFYDSGNGGFSAIRGTKDTFAQRVVIDGCIFYDLAGDAINYAAEKDDIGRYNVDDITITNCSFFRVLGLGINVLRGGSDESTAGPYVEIHRCNFEDVCNRERGSTMRLIGPQVMNISGCNFSNSGRGGAAIRLDEATWEKITIKDCNFWNAGRIITMTNKVVDGEIYKIEPKYVDAKSFNFHITPANQLTKLGIGLK